MNFFSDFLLITVDIYTGRFNLLSMISVFYAMSLVCVVWEVLVRGKAKIWGDSLSKWTFMGLQVEVVCNRWSCLGCGYSAKNSG